VRAQGAHVFAAGRGDVRPIASTTPVIAQSWPVLGGTGRLRFLTIYRCPAKGCGASHVAHLRGYLPARAERKLPCGNGAVVLLPVLKGATAA
jgi:hypothetical protein